MTDFNNILDEFFIMIFFVLFIYSSFDYLISLFFEKKYKVSFNYKFKIISKDYNSISDSKYVTGTLYESN